MTTAAAQFCHIVFVKVFFSSTIYLDFTDPREIWHDCRATRLMYILAFN